MYMYANRESWGGRRNELRIILSLIRQLALSMKSRQFLGVQSLGLLDPMEKYCKCIMDTMTLPNIQSLNVTDEGT